MSEFKGTPGPWSVLPMDARLTVVAYKPHPVVVCQIENVVSGKPIDEEDLGNAFLLAASTQLLEALTTLEMLSGTGMPANDPARVAARAVIKTALGQ